MDYDVGLPDVPRHYPAFIRQIIEERKKQWLAAQPWYQEMLSRAVQGSGMREQLQKPSGGSLVELYGQLGKGSMWEGHGGARVNIPMSELETLMLTLGGAGVAGRIHPPLIKPRDVKAFLPEVGIGYELKF